MILLTHPFGNANVRAVLNALDHANLLAKFVTTLGWSASSPFVQAMPENLRAQLARRAYDLPHYKIKTHPAREIVRLLSERLGLRGLTSHEKGWASIDRVWGNLDQVTAEYLRQNHERLKIRGVYAYEDCAERSFEAARELGLRRIYDLPIAYWETAQRLLREEAGRYPQWEPTLGGTRDSAEKLARKTRELELAEIVVCPSAFVLDSLPESARSSKRCVMAPFGSPAIIEDRSYTTHRTYTAPLRFLFAGALTQRKGLADLFAAMKLVGSNEAELFVMGSPVLPMSFYRNEFADFVYEPPRPHGAVLQLMRSCDVLVLPSIVEGRALVQQEAMACGLPLIVTRNAGGEDLIVEGKTGFLVPTGAPAAIAEKVVWFLQNRAELPGMSAAARAKAAELTWPAYGEKILHAIRD
ncbi:MAG TPA: glycosyltransferase [Chthoniobacterales bacterium]|nr:glycosyltransferase [Chthoniobacterales bacterium]